MESSGGSLDRLQQRVLAALAGLQPPFILGGGALAIHLAHRTTRDLDLFWDSIEELGELPREVRYRLRKAGLEESVVQESPTFVRIRAGDGTVVVIDLIADPIERLEEPSAVSIEGREILTESLPDILVNKLCALLSRSEIRDLVDVEAIVSRGGDLDAAVAAASKKDRGFSPLTLAWILREMDVKGLARAAGLTSEEAARVDDYRKSLIDRLIT